ncbi:MAG: putative surface protein with fasciclin (FAS1) repeats, partial [Paraglaciecola sp.]
NAQVIIADIVTPNGVVHVLDAVMLPPTFPTTVVDVVVNSDVHTTLEAAVIAAELADDLSAAGPFTVFAPTDAAFAALPAAFVTGLLANPTGQLAEILTYHAIGAQVLSGDLSDGQMASTLQGEDVTVTINADGVFINNAQVIIADIVTPNGVVHVLDAVMLPPTFPTTVVDVVVNSDVHTTLEIAVTAAELADDLSGAGPFTLFAPTDNAFADVNPVVLADLLDNPTGDLAQVLLYHTLSGQVLSGDLSDGQTAATLQGEDIEVTINADGVFINDSRVIIADIVTPNGVVHVLDAVMLPPSFVNVTDFEKVTLKITPNPTADYVQIELPQEMLNTTVEMQLIDFTGRVLETRIVNSTQAMIDLTSYPAGNYSILLVNDNSYAINKVIKN